ncbi:MAG: restriction endonuclease subunit S [Salinivirgaceae bacterium]|nr:restriction endonuclease subunit S [Salinivirgaceae bacterium]
MTINARINSAAAFDEGDVFSNLRPNPDWAKLPLFDRKGWKRVRFGDVVQMLKEQVDPLSGEVERYVAGEHMESENVHIRKWGKVGDGYLGPAFIRRFRKGQVLYGSRRTYLKKVALAEFDGVTANTTFVLQADEGKLLQELLPWLMLSDRFTQHSIRESKGSTNPYINFPDIAKYEFDLPPLDQQRRIAEILWTTDDVGTKRIAFENDANALIAAHLEHFLYHQSKWPLVECCNLLAEGPRNGFSPPAVENGGGLPTLSISAIRGGEVVPEGSLKYANVKEEDVAKFRLRKDDILVVRGNGNRLLCGRAGIVKGFPQGCFYPDLLIRLLFKAEALMPEFAAMQWNETRTHMRLLKKAKSSNGIYKINGQDIQSHLLIAPPIAAQKQFLEDHKEKTFVRDALIRSAAEHANLQHCLLKKLFG